MQQESPSRIVRKTLGRRQGEDVVLSSGSAMDEAAENGPNRRIDSGRKKTCELRRQAITSIGDCNLRFDFAG